MQQIDHTKNIIELSNISFSYGEESVLTDITLAIHKGDYLGIIGPNGGGKSTLLKIMLGLLTPKTGTVKLFNKDISKFKDWSKIGYVSQKVTHIDENYPMTVEEIVSMGRFAKRGLFKFLTKQDKDAVKEALCQVEMLNYRTRLIGDLSGGQQQRVFIARALASEPEVIVLDEPTVGVDIKTQEQFYALLQKLNKEFDKTLIMVTHELEVAAQETTELASVNRTITYYGPSKEFLQKKNLETLYGKGFALKQHA
ncbi:MAG TPA: metal ABC transporter ATP-binding protein [Candidatus Saccharimonadales bacterium]|nr:metal ABC transporter ATP-binding protein [Candidatus Saccharimonadales bacterium]